MACHVNKSNNTKYLLRTDYSSTYSNIFILNNRELRICNVMNDFGLQKHDPISQRRQTSFISRYLYYPASAYLYLLSRVKQARMSCTTQALSLLVWQESGLRKRSFCSRQADQICGNNRMTSKSSISAASLSRYQAMKETKEWADAYAIPLTTRYSTIHYNAPLHTIHTDRSLCPWIRFLGIIQLPRTLESCTLMISRPLIGWLSLTPNRPAWGLIA
jgi:hypothetical protein